MVENQSVKVLFVVVVVVVNLNHVNLILFLLFQLGANAILAVSLAVCKAGAGVNKIPLYKVLHESVVWPFTALLLVHFLL